MHFYIPDYQRGYRWSSKQVTDLLEDINAFEPGDKVPIYCIQPLVVKERSTEFEPIWEVIDGQQRLTTIYIILKSLLDSNHYTLEYQTRPGSQTFLEKINTSQKTENIDYYHIVQAKETIDEWLEEKEKEENFRQHFRGKLLNNVKFIWYKTIEDNPISVFTRLNIGKIALTNAELIKALIMNTLGIPKERIALQWDSIENALENDEFWYFLNKKEDTPLQTRIDFVFDIIRKNKMLPSSPEVDHKNPDLQYATFQYFYDYLEGAKNEQEVKKRISCIWKSVLDIFYAFDEWYNDIELFHYIGFIIHTDIKTVFELIKEWQTYQRKDQFICKRIKPLIQTKTDKIPINHTYDNGKGSLPKTYCRPLLLLYNLQFIINENKQFKQKFKTGIHRRFPFHIYQEENWDVEHIDSSTENELSVSNDFKDVVSFLWTSRISLSDMKDITGRIDEYLTTTIQSEDEHVKQTEFDKLAEEINSELCDEDRLNGIEEKNRIWNFVLLDSRTNRSYKNAIFPAKRRVIISKSQGRMTEIVRCNKETNVKDNFEQIGESNFYVRTTKGEQAFVPPCTLNAFLKFHTLSSSNLLAWTKTDAEAYQKAIIDLLEDAGLVMDNKNLISFWAYIQKYVITIPIIQRDYAQGRKGKEYLRRNFLASIKRALDNQEQCLVLDFVYGALRDSETVLPLDGQQRLTTLWLLHWYIAYKAGELTSAADTLKRFHYETRISSNEFIENLCSLNHAEENEKDCLKKYIKSQRWYRTTWDSDPTIKAMLTMIQGTDVKDSNGSDIIDGFVKLFAGCEQNAFKNYWEVLTEKNPIVFYDYAFEKENLPETDSLYIKMNARGKQLSDFENFKADLFNYLKTKSSYFEEKLNKIGAWFDNDGLDLFWNHSNKETNGFVIDEVFFAFLQRYFFKKLIDETSSDSIETVVNRKAFKLLFDRSNDKQQDTSYKDFSSYEDLGSTILSEKTFDELKKVSSSLKNIENINTLSNSKWSKDDRAIIIPQYIQLQDSVVSVSGITVKERLVFSSAIDYVEKNAQFDESSYKDWMRFVWNTVEETDTSSSESLIKVSRFLHSYAERSANIIEYLAQQDIKRDDSTELDRQFIEEIIKAKRIQSLREKMDKKSEDDLYTAERANFYKGSIRFLYTTSKDDSISIDWDNFDTKYNNSLKIFADNGVAEDYQDSLLCHFISIQTKWSQIKDIVFSNKADVWRTILRHKYYQSSIHEILISPESIKKVDSEYIPKLEDVKEHEREVQKDLYNHSLMKSIVNDMENAGRLHWRYGQYCIYPPNTKADRKKYIIATPRNHIISQLIRENKITLKQDRRIGDSDYLWGWNITFDFEGKTYCWDAWENLKYDTQSEKIEATDVNSFLELLKSTKS